MAALLNRKVHWMFRRKWCQLGSQHLEVQHWEGLSGRNIGPPGNNLGANKDTRQENNHYIVGPSLGFCPLLPFPLTHLPIHATPIHAHYRPTHRTCLYGVDCRNRKCSHKAVTSFGIMPPVHRQYRMQPVTPPSVGQGT